MTMRYLLTWPVLVGLAAAVGCDNSAAHPQMQGPPPANLPQPVKPAGPPGAGQPSPPGGGQPSGTAAPSSQ